jgi:parallel beta-helix repeat protein
MNNDYGIYMDNSSSNDIYGNSFFNSGIGIYGHQIDTWNSHNIDTTNLVNGKPIYYIKDQIGGAIPLGAGQVILANCTNVLIENQELTFASVGIELGFSSNIHITDNNVSSNDRLNEGMNTSGNPNATEGSNVNFCGIYLFNSHGNTIDNNLISENYRGILLEYSDWNTIEDNHLYFNKQVVYVFWSSNVSVLDNDMNGTIAHDSSVHPFRSSDVLISNNRILNGGHSVFIQKSNRVTVTQNYISSSNGEGVRLEGAEDIVITHNDIIANGLGIRMFHPFTHNVIHHNNIIDNDIQAIDWESSQWDEGYPSGGNYWSDYGGTDVFKGPKQDIPGSDGIGDKPYIIDGDSQDNYPLMDPAGHDQESYALSEGWNLISTPLIQSNTYFLYMLASISGSYDIVQWYDNEDESDHWKLDHISKPLYMNDLNNIDHTMGLWVHVTEPGGVTFDNYGSIPKDNQDISLSLGWNLVGYPSSSNRTRSEALNNIVFGTDVDAIWSFDAQTQQWDEIGGGDELIMGKGYWIHSLSEITWEVPL